MVKYVANTWHATKIGFANEVGRIAKAFGVDGRAVMGLIAQDAKLNVSPVYMRPGFRLRRLMSAERRQCAAALRGRDARVHTVISGLPASNRAHIDQAVAAVLRHGRAGSLCSALPLNRGTDDLRESPAVSLVKRLIGEGCEVRIYDREVHTAQIMGTNLAYIRAHVPHFEALLADTVEDCLAWSDVVVVTYAGDGFAEAMGGSGQVRPIVDLAGLFTEPPGAVSTMASPGSVLILDENLPVPFDRRVWNESLALWRTSTPACYRYC